MSLRWSCTTDTSNIHSDTLALLYGIILAQEQFACCENVALLNVRLRCASSHSSAYKVIT